MVFDWDGTLMDSTAAIVRAARLAIDQLGLPHKEEAEIMNIIGLGLRDCWEQLFPELDGGGFERFVECYRDHYLAPEQQISDLYAGARELLAGLHGRGALLAVATGKSRRGLERDLARTGLGGLFHGSRTADETAPKPDPAMLLELLHELGIEPGNALMVGDTEYDLEMAARAGVRAVGVGWGAHAPARLVARGPLACVAAMEELAARLEDFHPQAPEDTR